MNLYIWVWNEMSEKILIFFMIFFFLDVPVVMKMNVSISAGNYLYSYIIIPATIKSQKCMYNYRWLSITFVSLLFYTHAHRHYFIYDIFVRCNKSSDAPITKDNTLFNLSDKKCELQSRAFLTIVSVQSAHFILFNHSCRLCVVLAETAGMR